MKPGRIPAGVWAFIALGLFAAGVMEVFGVGWAMIITGAGSLAAIAARCMGRFVVDELHAVRELVTKKSEAKGAER